jgi:hypothetical protein
MRRRWKAAFIAAALASSPAAAQVHQNTGVPTDTQARHADNDDNDLIWNLVGLLGLLGAFGLWRASDNDGYTDDPV